MKLNLQRLTQAREDLGLKQKEVAERLGYKSGNTISHWETNKREISAVDLGRLAKLYDVSVSWLYGETNTKSDYKIIVSKKEYELISLLRHASDRDRAIVESILTAGSVGTSA
jgi:transcriptional regulator with XRE-family HTH domain